MGPRSAASVAALLGAVVGFATGRVWTAGDTPAPPAAASPTPAADDAPRGAIGGARADAAERERLRGEVERLEALLAQAQDARNPPPQEPDEPGDGGDDGGEAEAERLAALRAAGWTSLMIERLRAAYEAFELERLYLRDQATREGWRRSPRFRDEQRALLEDLRAELGEGDFDAALYARGRNNRVRVQSLLDGSPAEAAGVRTGDEILRYAGERIYEPTALVRLTVEGERGRPVELRVLRDGEEIRLFAPRGPLGARLQAVSRPPFARP